MVLKVKLLQHSSIMVAELAGRISHESIKDETKVNEESAIPFLQKLIKLGHDSVLEHISYSWLIEGLSRAALQELARHRMASMTVRSTRFTLNKFVKQDNINVIDLIKPDLDPRVKELTIKHMNELIDLAKKEKIPNDKLKYALPEAFETRLVWTINARSLRNFFKLRSDRSALAEMQELAHKIYMELPNLHTALYNDVVKL
jgi:thymidylate synthase (FAD)